MRQMGLQALYPRRRTSQPGKGHKVDPCLLRNLVIDRPNLRAYEAPAALREGLARYFDFCNARRHHSALDRCTPDAVYFDQAALGVAA